MTSNKYVVLNCPTLMGNRLCYSKVIKQCADCTDCVIKQVVEIAKDIIEKDCYENSDAKAEKILRLFDIEEVNK